MSSLPASPPPADGSDTPRPSGSRLEILFAGASSALFFGAFLVLPAAGLLALPFAAVPVVRVAHRRGMALGLAASGFAAALMLSLEWATRGGLAATGVAFFAVTLTALPAVFAGLVRRGVAGSAAYLGLCSSGFALACLFLLAHPARTDMVMQHEIDQAFDEWVRISSEPGGSKVEPETAARIRLTLDAARAFTKRFWVGLIGVFWVLGSAIAFYTGAWAARPAPSAAAASFEQLRVAPAVAALFVVCGAGWALLVPKASRIAGSILWPLVALYFTVGLSIICHFARRWFRVRILRVGFYALVVYVPINVGVALLGLFDWYLDFRHRGGEIKQS